MDASHGYYANGGTANYNPYGYQGYPQPPTAAAGLGQQAGGAQVMSTTPPSTGDAANKKRKVGGKRASKASVASMAEVAAPAAGLDQSLRSGYAVASAGSAPDYGAISAASHVPSMATPTYNDPFANVTRGLDDAHKQELSNYWQATISDMEENEHDFKTHSLPLARIKKVMKADEDVKMISAEAPVLFAKGCEIFITELTMRAWIHAEQNKRRTLQRSDIANAIGRSDMFDFLIDIVPREEFVANRVDDSAAGGGGIATAGSATAGSAHSGVEEVAKVGPPQQGYPSMTIGNGHDGGIPHTAMYAGAYANAAGQPQQQQQQQPGGGHDSAGGMHDPRAQFLYHRQQQPGMPNQPQQQQQHQQQQQPQAGHTQSRSIPPGYAQYAPQAHPYYMESMYNPYVAAAGGGGGGSGAGGGGQQQQQQQQQQQGGAASADGNPGAVHGHGHPHQTPHTGQHAHNHSHPHGVNHSHPHPQAHAHGHPQHESHAPVDGRLGSANGRGAGNGY